jgi:predicted nucleic acid-binding protein
LSGAASVATAQWIEVKAILNQSELAAAEARLGIGVGELSTIVLAKELKAELALLDDLRARRLARAKAWEFAQCRASRTSLPERRDLESSFRVPAASE